MIFTWRRRRGGCNGRKDKISVENINQEFSIPIHFCCPISLDLMKDPVTLSTGITYDRENIERWIDSGNRTCPVTNQVLQNYDQIPNHTLRKMIQDWCVKNTSHGIERIPTPRIPVTAYQVSEICSKILDAAHSGDEKKCQDLLRKIKTLARESERNKRCIAGNGTGYALSAAFESFASISTERYADLLKDILSTLTWMFPFGEEGLSKLGSETSLRCMAWFLKGEDLSIKQNALLVLKELLSLNQNYVDRLIEIKGVDETLFKIVEEPICPKTTKASLVIIYYMMKSSNEKITLKFVEMGLVPLILEILVDGEKSTSEKALGVLDSICNCQEGKENASNNALTIPILVKKLLRVSNMTTEFTVSILWKLCKKEDENLQTSHETLPHNHEKEKAESVVFEALQAGGFQKVLLVLQVGFRQTTKEKATELLKLMNVYKDRLECFDSTSGFKYLKSSY